MATPLIMVWERASPRKVIRLKITMEPTSPEDRATRHPPKRAF